jgi:arylsulfatase A-like enzyme
MHLTGPHIPWLNKNPVCDFGRRPADLYDGELAKVDRLLGVLVDALRRLSVWDDCVMVVTADHGTALGEHGRLAGYLLYEEQIRVPLLIKVPGLRPRVVGDLVATIDLAPTLVNLMQPGTRHRFHGRSLLPLMTGERKRLAPRPIVSFCAFRDSYAIIDGDGRWKLHHHRSRQYEVLYDLAADPGEHSNLISTNPEEAASLRILLDAFLWEGRASWGNPYHYREDDRQR